jgi:hypothetical protein
LKTATTQRLNRPSRNAVLRGVLLLCLAVQPVSVAAQTSSPQGQAAPPPPSPGAQTPQEIANQVNNPAAPVTLIQFRDILIPGIPGTDGVSNGLQMQPVLPIGPFQSFQHAQLIKITLPLHLTVPGYDNGSTHIGGDAGFGDIQLFDLLSIKQSWGRWGVGAAFVFPTATDSLLGSGKWQAGPAMALIYTGVKNLTAGAVIQNPISVGGDSSRPDVNHMLITPTFTFNLAHGWFVGMSDYNWVFDWENGGDATVPIGVQVGKLVRIGRQPVSLSVETGGSLGSPSGTPNPGLILGFEVSPVFAFHIGPHRIRLRN